MPARRIKLSLKAGHVQMMPCNRDQRVLDSADLRHCNGKTRPGSQRGPFSASPLVDSRSLEIRPVLIGHSRWADPMEADGIRPVTRKGERQLFMNAKERVKW